MRGFIIWLDRHGGAVQAIAATVTVVIAAAALMGVKLQIDSSARIQREQSARDIYREYLNLSISRAEFAAPDYCALVGTPAETAYENYVEYMLYTAEQTIAADGDWESVFEPTMRLHQDYLCTIKDWSGYSGDVETMGRKFVARQCANVVTCDPANERQK